MDDHRDLVALSIRESGYEGWVAYLRDGTPLFEAVPHNPLLLSVIRGGHEQPVRPADRSTMGWEDVPLGEVDRLELYYARERTDLFPGQPVVRLDRPSNEPVLFFAIKMGGVVTTSGFGLPQQELRGLPGPERTGLQGYRVGWWNRASKEPACEMVEVTRSRGIKRLGTRIHPCSAKPFGFGLKPSLFGLTAADVPRFALVEPSGVPA